MIHSNTEVEEFRRAAAEWLDDHHQHAPRDYGAICPPELVDAGVAWQRRLHDAGYAGIHWPEEHGGRVLTPEHNSVWQLECAKAAVPAMLNMSDSYWPVARPRRTAQPSSSRSTSGPRSPASGCGAPALLRAGSGQRSALALHEGRGGR